MSKVISAYEARTHFGELLNRVYYAGEEIVIARKGVPLVKWIKLDSPSQKRKDPFRETAGSWKDVDTSVILKKIYRSRKDQSRAKQFLAVS